MVAENRWRAQRYGVSEGFIDFGRKSLIPFAQAVDELIELIAQDAEALDCMPEVAAARDILTTGTSADQQRSVFEQAKASGANSQEALNAVVQHLISEFQADL
jgi:carboxylate-amine ligase